MQFRQAGSRMFLFFLFPAFLILFFGLAISRAGQRGACAAIWVCSLLVSNISAYLAGSLEPPRIWLVLALGAPLICVVFGLYSRFAQANQNSESEASNLLIRRLKIATLAIALLPISCIIIAKFQMMQFAACVADCKPCKELQLTCSALSGFSAPRVSGGSMVYTGTLIGQGVFLEAHLHEGAVVWECHVFPKLFGNDTCQGYDVGWH